MKLTIFFFFMNSDDFNPTHELLQFVCVIWCFKNGWEKNKDKYYPLHKTLSATTKRNLS